MSKKIVYVVGGLTVTNGMSQVLSQKINYLAENTDFEIYMILTEKKGTPWIYKISEKVEYVNFDINFDELDTMPLLKKIIHYKRKQSRYKRLFTKYLMEIKADITISTCRREINFINNIKDGSIKIGEFHFNRTSYRQLNKSYLPHFINNLISKYWINSLVKEIKKLDQFIVLSQEDKKEWKEIKNIYVIYNPIKDLPTDFSDCKNHKVIAVGSYSHVKGFDLLFEAWKNVEIRHPDWTLNIYGNGDYDKYQKMSNQYNTTTITCNPSVLNIYDKYKESSIFVLSSRHEGFGLVIAEAMSCGIPAISFACPCGPKDIVRDGIDGILVKQEDTHDLADKICFLIENEDVRIQMGQNAIENSKRFNVDIIMEQWINLFNKL